MGNAAAAAVEAAAEVGKPDGQRLEAYQDANFPALKQEITCPLPSMQISKRRCWPGG